VVFIICVLMIAKVLRSYEHLRLVFFLLILLWVIPIGSQAAGTENQFSDVDSKSEVGQAIDKLGQAGIINGYPDGTFLPDKQLTRAEFVKIANLQFGLLLSDEKIDAFTDVSKEHWAYQQVMIARKAGYIQGIGNNCFSPSTTLTREQFCVMVGRIQNYQDLLGIPIPIKDSVSDWAKEGVKAAISCGLFTLPADGRFRATEPITRGEVCLALSQYVLPLDATMEAEFGGIGGGTVPIPSQPTDKEKEEAEMAGYIKDMVSKYNSMNLNEYTSEVVVKDILAVLMDCMKEALTARQNGVFLSREYINQQYASKISQFKSTYSQMTANQINDTQVIVGNLAELYKIEAVMNYFDVDFK